MNILSVLVFLPFQFEVIIYLSSMPISSEDSVTSVITVPRKKLTVKLSEDDIFDLDEAVTIQSQTIKKLMACFSSDAGDPIPLPIRRPIFTKINEFCNKQLDAPDSSSTLTEINNFKVWESNFFNQLKHDLDTLYELIEGATYLGIKSLLDQTCQCVADMMKGKTVQQVRDLFHIVNDYTPEEEERVSRESTWIFMQ